MNGIPSIHLMFPPSKSILGALLVILTYGALLSHSPAVEPGYTPLLDREHTNGWKYVGDGAMKVEDGVASTSANMKPESGLYWYQKRTFADFTLRLEFNVDTDTSNSGIYVRIPDPKGDYKVAGAKGYEIDIYGGKTGSIIFLPVRLRPAKPVPVAPGKWQEMEVTAVGQKYTVKLNGQVINEYLGNRALSGYIGLETWHGEGDVHFRNVRIKDLSDSGGPAVAANSGSPTPSPSTQIEPLLEPCLDAILAPLEKDPGMPRIAVEKLRASLGGGAVKAKTPSQKQIYQSGIAVCEALTTAMDERAQARAAAMASAQVPSPSNGASIVNTMPLRGRDAGHAGDAIRGKQRDERNYADDKAWAASGFMESSAYKAWVAKSASLRENVMGLYGKLVKLEAAEPDTAGTATPSAK